MPRFKVAHLHELGQDMVIVPLEPDFGNKTESAQQQIIADLQAHSVAAGLRGTVVPVWLSGRRMMFIAPQPWHPFFTNLDINTVLRNVNKELFW
ncbi:MAG: hypothetical protein JSS69_15005 [Acidobacteria bacterium]|nr:hypothetical protein [Acidobacteriota bacterium]MBS1867220.1 hypothetical protein [Acidobacteriota bacterium]